MTQKLHLDLPRGSWQGPRLLWRLSFAAAFTGTLAEAGTDAPGWDACIADRR